MVRRRLRVVVQVIRRMIYLGCKFVSMPHFLDPLGLLLYKSVWETWFGDQDRRTEMAYVCEFAAIVNPHDDPESLSISHLDLCPLPVRSSKTQIVRSSGFCQQPSALSSNDQLFAANVAHHQDLIGWQAAWKGERAVTYPSIIKAEETARWYSPDRASSSSSRGRGLNPVRVRRQTRA
jgi:hypothetical protein